MNTDEIINIIRCEDHFYAALYKMDDDERPKDQKQKDKSIQQDIESCLTFTSTL